jgi:hypothetical protein
MSQDATARNKPVRRAFKAPRLCKVSPHSVMAGLDPAIHEFAAKTWMPGTSPGMTFKRDAN